MEPFSFSIDYRLEDWRVYSEIARERAQRVHGVWQRLQVRWPGALLGMLILGGLFWFSTREARFAWAIGMATSLLLIAIQSVLVMRRMRPLAGGAFLEPARIDVGADGLRILRANSEAFVRWARVMEVSATPTHIVLWVDQLTGHVLPVRALPAGLSAEDAMRRIESFRSTAVGSPAEQTAATAPAAPARSSVWREIATLGRLLLMLPVDGANLVGRDLTIFVTVIILLAVWIPLDPLVFGPDLEFTPYALPALAWIALGALGLAWILSRLVIPALPYRRAFLLVLGVAPIAMVASTVAAFLDDPWLFGLVAAITIWVLVYFGRGLRALTGTHQGRAVLVAGAAALIFLVSSDLLYVSPSLWYSSDDEDTEEPEPGADTQTWARMEELQFAQQARLDEELARIAALPREHAVTYFVGFAGYGEQRVFAEEIALADQQVAARYGSAQRSIELVNDQRDPEKFPLASAPALRHTLQSVGSMMAPDDVLFLALSSHGSEDGSISVSNAGRVPADLGAVELADMLREAKIPWKVVVVSACYAGGFIDALRDDHTIVLAAAAPDRTSFGCADDRDLTYFGEAFYRDALPRSANLRAAFENARKAIAAREKQEGIEASDPQAYFGKLIEQKLVLR